MIGKGRKCGKMWKVTKTLLKCLAKEREAEKHEQK